MVGLGLVGVGGSQYSRMIHEFGVVFNGKYEYHIFIKHNNSINTQTVPNKIMQCSMLDMQLRGGVINSISQKRGKRERFLFS